MIGDSTEIMKRILDYYKFNPGVGHTTTMLKGAENSDCIIVSANSNDSERFCGMGPGFRRKLKVLSSFISGGMCGLMKPLAWDNFTLMSLFYGVIRDIANLQSTINKSNSRLSSMICENQNQGDEIQRLKIRLFNSAKKIKLLNLQSKPKTRKKKLYPSTQPQKHRCKGVKGNGTPCKRWANMGSDYCSEHPRKKKA